MSGNLLVLGCGLGKARAWRSGMYGPEPGLGLGDVVAEDAGLAGGALAGSGVAGSLWGRNIAVVGRLPAAAVGRIRVGVGIAKGSRAVVVIGRGNRVVVGIARRLLGVDLGQVAGVVVGSIVVDHWGFVRR